MSVAVGWLLHRHAFAPDKWELLREMSTWVVEQSGDVSERPVRVILTYSNTCVTCGDIVFRKVDL